MDIDTLISKIESQLAANVYDASANQSLIKQATSLMAENRELGAKLGPLVGRLKSAPQPKNDIALQWVELLAGHIAVGHRPKIKSLKQMKDAGATHIMTLLSEKEGAQEIGRAAKKQGLKWIWLPLPSAEPPENDKFEEIEDVFRFCADELQDKAKIYIHCSAGIHRTGMMAYALCRHIGLDSDDSTACLTKLRDVTSKEVGEHRKSWGDQFCQHNHSK